MSWDIDFALDPGRLARLTELATNDPLRWDGTNGEPARVVLASAQFHGAPGRDADAARAWAAEMRVYFRRGTGEPPVVSYRDGIYTVTGPITTSHPGDTSGPDGIVHFT